MTLISLMTLNLILTWWYNNLALISVAFRSEIYIEINLAVFNTMPKLSQIKVYYYVNRDKLSSVGLTTFSSNKVEPRKK